MSRRLAVLLGCAIGWAGMFGPAHGQTLKEALAKAYLNNPTLEAERANLRAIDENVPQALSNWRPELELSGDLSRSETFADVRTFGGKDQVRTPRSVELNITQSLFRGFRTEAAIREAEIQVLAARARLSATEQTVLLDATRAYVNVYREQAVLELNINNEQVLSRQLEATRDRFQVGEVTRTDVSQAEARLAGATADRVQAEGDLEASRAAYRNVIGEVPGRLAAPDPVLLGGVPADKKSSLDIARDNNPNVAASVFDERAARHNVKEVRGELLPEISLQGTLNRAIETINNTSKAHEKSITATMSFPLYQSGSVYSRLRAAKQAVGQGRFLIDAARRNAVQDATRWWEALQTARARIKSFSAQVRANEIALEGVEREAEVGARTVLDTLDAEQELLDSRVNLVRAQRDEVVAVFELKVAMGRLTARQIGLGVDFYDPLLHYNEVRDKWLGTHSSGEIHDVDELEK